MLREIQDLGREIELLTLYEITSPNLDEEASDVRLYGQTFQILCDMRGCTLMCYRWTGPRRRNLTNFPIYYYTSIVFLESNDAANEHRDVDYILSLMDAIVQEISDFILFKLSWIMRLVVRLQESC